MLPPGPGFPLSVLDYLLAQAEAAMARCLHPYFVAGLPVLEIRPRVSPFPHV